MGCAQALDVVCKHSPIIEVGAGLGHWERELSARGASVLAVDNRSALPLPDVRITKPTFVGKVRVCGTGGKGWVSLGNTVSWSQRADGAAPAWCVHHQAHLHWIVQPGLIIPAVCRCLSLPAMGVHWTGRGVLEGKERLEGQAVQLDLPVTLAPLCCQTLWVCNAQGQMTRMLCSQGPIFSAPLCCPLTAQANCSTFRCRRASVPYWFNVPRGALVGCLKETLGAPSTHGHGSLGGQPQGSPRQAQDKNIQTGDAFDLTLAGCARG